MEAAALVASRTIPRPSRLYWTCQAAGWSGFLTYVLGGYWIFAPRHHAEDVVSIVAFCVVVPPLMTHGLRAWMYRYQWARLRGWRRWLRQFIAALVLAAAATFLIGVLAGLSTGRLWTRTEGMGWTFLAYALAFAGWLWIYDLVHERRRREELEHVVREAQLRALRAQLNPHFMFNSLNSLRNAIIEHPARAVSMVTGLADILRYSLASDQKDTVTLAEELSIVDEYLNLERARFEDRLRIERSVEPSALDAQVPPMLVQTLVENAVKHGVSPSKTGGEVRLEARVRGGRAEVVVTSSGAFQPPADGSGRGLRNATERLRLLYGTLASLKVAEHNGTTVASLTVPLERPA